MLAFVGINNYSLAFSFHATEKNTSSYTISSSCYSNYCVYLPIALNYYPVPEIDIPPCRWPFSPNNTLYITYKWGNNLQVPGSTWRNAFESGINSWNYTSTWVWFYFNSGSNNIINVENNPSGNYRGITYQICSGGYTIKVDVLGNLYWDLHDQYTILERRGIATHEIGHATSIGHIPNWYPYTALMYKISPLEFYNTIYNPQSPDELLVNQIYP